VLKVCLSKHTLTRRVSSNVPSEEVKQLLRKAQSVFILDLINRVWSTCACSSVFIADIWTDLIVIAGRSSCFSRVQPFLCVFICIFPLWEGV